MNNLKKGSILSELQFYVVQEVTNDLVTVSDENGTIIEIGKEYVEKLCHSADSYEKEEKVPATKLAEILLNSTRIAITVCYRKKDEVKSASKLKAEKEALKQKLLTANVNDLPKLIDELIENPVQLSTPGEIRIMRGFHNGNTSDLGRLNFVDMEVEKDKSKNYDNRLKQVDPRTIEYIIVNNVKYIKK